MDGRGFGLKRLLPALAAATAMLATAPGSAQPTHDYFTSLAVHRAAPRQLNQADHDYYVAVFAALDRQDWATAQALLNQRSGGLLHPVAYAELYTAANSPRACPPITRPATNSSRPTRKSAPSSRPSG